MQDNDFREPQKPERKIPNAKQARVMVEEAILGSSNQTKVKIDALIMEGYKEKSISNFLYCSFKCRGKDSQGILCWPWLQMGS